MTLRAIPILLAATVCSAAPSSEGRAGRQKLAQLQRQVATRLGRGYRVQCFLRPCFLRADFDGDHAKDVAVLVVQGSKRGIALLTTRAPPTVLGAGTEFGNGGDDFAWLDHWRVDRSRTPEPGADSASPPTPLGDMLLIEKTESAGALVIWDGQAFRWYQQGD